MSTFFLDRTMLPDHTNWFIDLNKAGGPIWADQDHVRIRRPSRYLNVEKLLAHAKNDFPGGTRCKLFDYYRIAYDPDRDVLHLVRISMTKSSRQEYNNEKRMEDLYSFRC
jgi:hypothetical protein